MTPPPPRILKHNIRDAPLPPLAEFDVFSTPQPQRIPAGRVGGHPMPTGEPIRPRTVLHRTEASVLAFEPPLFDHTPAFALPTLAPEPEPASAPDPVPLDLDAERAAWDAAWQERLDAAVALAREEAYAAGQADAEAAHRETVDAARDAFVADAACLRTTWDAFRARFEPELAHLAFTIAEAILDAPLPDAVKQVSSQTLTTALDHLAGEGPVLITLHPVDLLRLQEAGLVEQLVAVYPGLRWEARPDLKPGEWAAHSSTGLIRRLQAELLGNLRTRLGLEGFGEGS